MRALALIACAGLAVATAATAKEEKPQQQEGDKIVCKRQGDADTGSHFASPKKVCRTKSEWKELEDSADQTVQSLRNHGSISGVPAGGGGGPH